ncbi:type I restriction endonuclease [Thermodesulfobacteriota bacterium B35]
MVIFDLKFIHNESDVEQKIVMPLLKEVLGYDDQEIRTKDYLAPTLIDKGAGKKMGYFPDYIVYLGGIPILVVEVKDLSVPSEEGYREARLYSAEINKRYPEGINPVKYIVSTNGENIYISPWDSEKDLHIIETRNLQEGSRELEILKAYLSRKLLLKHAKEIRGRIYPVARFKPLFLIGGPSRQNSQLAPNSFAADLVPLLRKYFDPDETKWSEEILEKGYCSSEEITKYNSTLESLLKERVLLKSGVESVKTTKKKADVLDKALKKAVNTKSDIPDPFILIIGGVGTGKSMFIERYYKHLINTEIKKETLWCVIDFNTAPQDIENLETWICKEFISDFGKRNCGQDFLSFENLRRYFAPDIAKRERGPYKLLKEHNFSDYIQRITDDITKWNDDPQKLSEGIIRYFSKDKNIPVIVVFDNVDKRDRDQQLSIFQSVQWFRSKNKCFTILSLRDETFDAYKDSPPLDAFLKPFAFRIIPPRFINVVKKRLELAINFLTSQTDKNLTYTLPNGFQVTYPSTKLGKYLLSIYLSVFNPRRKISLILEALSGKNIRRALEMFSDILISGYFRDDLIFSITEGNRFSIQEWLIIRVLMRSNYEFFADNHGYVQNLLAVQEESKTSNNFILLEILEYLASRRKKKTSFKIEGYHYVPKIQSYCSKLGYTKEDVMWALELLLNKGLIIADHQRATNIKSHDYIKISASGYYHLRFLSSRTEYISSIPIDTYFNNEDIAKRISQLATDSMRNRNQRMKLLKEYLSNEYEKSKKNIPEFEFFTESVHKFLEKVEKAITFENGKLN